MPAEIIYLTILASVLGLLGATYTDLKERIVPSSENILYQFLTIQNVLN
jgi:energy-converting hydrogenase Eha subunit A